MHIEPIKNDISKIESIKMVEVIEVKLTRGDGTSNSPVRVVTEFWNKEGKRLADDDICKNG